MKESNGPLGQTQCSPAVATSRCFSFGDAPPRRQQWRLARESRSPDRSRRRHPNFAEMMKRWIAKVFGSWACMVAVAMRYSVQSLSSVRPPPSCLGAALRKLFHVATGLRPCLLALFRQQRTTYTESPDGESNRAVLSVHGLPAFPYRDRDSKFAEFVGEPKAFQSNRVVHSAQATRVPNPFVRIGQERCHGELHRPIQTCRIVP